ncbi:MAG: aminotransferase class III-fold pyridoxal phosphate-dependent enzyme [Planctomycetes bacterium]|nr:aminotransferase class III-fold pyridoxal phosphate-dependent enzyme [Planctomycetota bacterium]
MNTQKGKALKNKAKDIIPGLSQLLSKRPDMFSPDNWPTYYKKAKGAEVWDLDNNHYLDMSISGIGANVLGYADDDVDEAVINCIRNGSSSSLNAPEDVELATLLCDLHPWADMAKFTRTGGEAMAVAVRIARSYTQKSKIAFCGYHGWHDWYLAANLSEPDALGQHLIPNLSPRGVPKELAQTAFPFHYNKLDELESILINNKGEMAAIVMEPIRNLKPQNNFLRGVRELANKHGVALIVDEISAGFRLHTGGAHLKLGLEPDIAVFSKALGNGYPIAAIIGKRDIMDSAQESFISSTMWTERVGPVAALATIKKHQELNVAEHLIRVGQQVQQGWKELASKHGLKVDVGGIEPLSHFSFLGDDSQMLKTVFTQNMLSQGVLASTLFYSMYAHTQDHISTYLKAANTAFESIANAKISNNLNSLLEGPIASTGFTRLN